MGRCGWFSSSRREGCANFPKRLNITQHKVELLHGTSEECAELWRPSCVENTQHQCCSQARRENVSVLRIDHHRLPE